jgi:hypothetical protein
MNFFLKMVFVVSSLIILRHPALDHCRVNVNPLAEHAAIDDLSENWSRVRADPVAGAIGRENDHLGALHSADSLPAHWQLQGYAQAFDNAHLLNAALNQHCAVMAVIYHQLPQP